MHSTNDWLTNTVPNVFWTFNEFIFKAIENNFCYLIKQILSKRHTMYSLTFFYYSLFLDSYQFFNISASGQGGSIVTWAFDKVDKPLPLKSTTLHPLTATIGLVPDYVSLSKSLPGLSTNLPHSVICNQYQNTEYIYVVVTLA